MLLVSCFTPMVDKELKVRMARPGPFYTQISCLKLAAL